jgi:hypothetical protein
MDKIINCLNPSGDLFTNFIANDEKIQIAVDLFNELYNLKYLIMNETYLYSDSIESSRKQLSSINTIKENLTDYYNDFSLTTNRESILNIQDEIDELNKYSYSAKYQETCNKFSPIYWTSKDCPTSIEQCKIISNSPNLYYTADNTCNFKANSGYNSMFTNVYEIENKYLNYLKSYNDENQGNIEDFNGKLDELLREYKNKLVKNMLQALKDSTVVVDLDFNVFKDYVNNDPIENPENYENPNVDIFSFLNCSSIGRDLNVTIFTIKKNLSKDCLTVCIFTYLMNFIAIFVSVLTVFLLNLYKYDENEEIQNKIKDTENKNLINNEETQNNENFKTDEKLEQNGKEKSENSNSNTNTEDKKNEDFLMNKNDNNNLMNSINNPVNIEVVKNENTNSEESKEMNQNSNENKYQYDDDF